MYTVNKVGCWSFDRIVRVYYYSHRTSEPRDKFEALKKLTFLGEKWLRSRMRILYT